MPTKSSIRTSELTEAVKIKIRIELIMISGIAPDFTEIRKY